MWQKLATLGLALAWDRWLGEPPSKIHPVTWMGRLSERILGGPATGDERADYDRGVKAAVGVPLATMAATVLATRMLSGLGTIPGLIGGAFLLKSSFAITGMTREAENVEMALARNDLDEARGAVGKIVSRDVSTLDESGVASAAIGSVAENVTDSVVGPMLMYGMFGLPAAMAYRAVDTLDSMIGYHGDNEHLGKAAARIDDVVGYVPARVAGGTIVVSAAMQEDCDAWRAAGTMIMEHGHTQSPNGGWPIGATAGALGVEIEKVGYYRLGPSGVRPSHRDVRRSVKLFNGAAAVATVLAFGLIVSRRR